jgi:hypothetical protein
MQGRDELTLTRDFKETIRARVRRDIAFREALLREAILAGAAAFERGNFRSFDSFDDLVRYLEQLTEAAITEETGR